MDGERTSEGPSPSTNDLLVDDRTETVIVQHPRSAELLRNRQAEETDLSGRKHSGAIDFAVRVPAVSFVVSGIPPTKLLDHVAEGIVVFVVKFAIHGRKTSRVG